MKAIIAGVSVHPLKRIPDERGMVMHMIRCDDRHFVGFGEIYFSLVYPGVVKAWHLHTTMTLNYAVVVGMAKLALYDDRPSSSTRGTCEELFLGEANYCLVQIPPGIWNGFKGLGVTPALVANCASHPHDPAEIIRRDAHDKTIPYQWEIQNQ